MAGICNEIRNIVSEALTDCLSLSKTYNTAQDVIEDLKTQNSFVHSKFRSSIAKGIAKYMLRRFGQTIRNIRLYGSVMEFRAGKYSDIDMIVRVEKLDDELVDNLKSIDRLLSKEYFRLIGEDCGNYFYFIDIKIIDDDPGKQVHPARAYLEYIMANDSVAV